MPDALHQYSVGINPMFVAGFGIIFAILAIAVLVLKGYSLWHAAKRDEKWWFIILLVVNTMGILELVYLIFIVKLWHKDIPAVKTDSTNNSTQQPSNSTQQTMKN